MRKLNLVALAYDRDGILNALQRTNAVEIKEHAATEGTESLPIQGEELRAYLATLETSLDILTAAAESGVKARKEREALLQDGFSVTYAEFAAAAELRERMDLLVKQVNTLTDEKNAIIAEQAQLTRAIAAAAPYKSFNKPFDYYVDTLHVKTRFGTLTVSAWENLKKVLDDRPLADYEVSFDGESALLAVFAHRSVFSEVEDLLSGSGFTPCPYSGTQTGAQYVAALESRLETAKAKQRETEEAIYALAPEIRNLKIYCDYIGFELEKAEVAGKMRGTERTFFLEAFVPAQEEATVKEALDGLDCPIWYEFSDPAEDEPVPTLLKNNPVVANFETITNMYSVPNARELDPNTVMSFFYSLFLGFIMADVGYGLLMLLGGGFLYFKNKRGGLKSLAGAFAICGIFTIVWGILFNSVFGISLPFYTSPMPVSYNLATGEAPTMYSLSGISLPGVLVISLLLGVVQLMAGYLCRAAQHWRRGAVMDGIFDGLIWAIFSVGAGLAVIGLVEDFNASILALVGAIIAGASLLVAVCTAGRKEKFLGKITKGFGSLYSLINYFTDVLSYIRLYGLMLTGAVIAQVVSQYSIQLMTSGSVLAVLGVILIVVGHIFNLAIGLLGAYIHTARLQYVEFFGRFYEGEGALFTPLGSQQKYIWVSGEGTKEKNGKTHGASVKQGA